MARTEKTVITYESILRKGVRESDMDGTIIDSGEDEFFRVQVNKVTEIQMWDGRGRNWAAGSKHREQVADLSLEEAADLAKCLVGDIAYAAVVAERRVVIPPKGA